MDDKFATLWKALLLASLPLLCCALYCAVQGGSLWEVYPPSSEWNDELFYYKQVESILNFGYPQGYFGFNESHAQKLSFAAWSPVLVFPWILWGLLFGWNLMSAVYCNIFLMGLACFLFVWLVRPTWKQMGVAAFLFGLYRPLARFMLSLMAETICFAGLILFYSMALNYLRREKGYKLALLFLASGLMTLMRPYLALSMLLPMFLWIRRGKGRVGKWRNAAAGAGVLAAVLGLYAGIKRAFGAEYFAPLFYTDWIMAFLERGFFGGVYFTLRKLYYVGMDFLSHIQRAFCGGLASGAYFVGYLACMGVLAAQCVRDFRLSRRLRREGAAAQGRKAWEMLVVEGHLLLSFVAMFFALLLMYKLTEGSRHLITFLAAAIFVVALMDTKFYKKAVLLGVIFAYFHSYMALDPFDYQVPFLREERRASVEAWEEALAERLALETEDVPNYDNVVIWVFDDMVDGRRTRTAYQLLYGLPKGFGISCCMRDYVVPNLDVLKSRYLAIPTGGEIDLLCKERGYELVYGDGELVFYALR